MAQSAISSYSGIIKHIRVPERGFIDLGSGTWELLRSTKGFQHLHDKGILEVVYLPSGVRIKGTCYVGHALCGDVLLEFREKVEGALASLLVFASHKAFKLAHVRAGSTNEITDLITLLVEQFLDAAALYISSGRKFQYISRPAISPLAGGKLDITKSIQLRARGLKHLLAFEKPAVTYNTTLNRIVLTALSEIEKIACSITLPGHITSKARGLAMIFSDCRNSETLYRERSYFVEQATLLSTSSDLNDYTKDMLSLSGILLSHMSFDPLSEQIFQSPRSWFINLERLFEKAIFNIFSSICTDCTVSRGENSQQYIFSNELKEYRAHPDLVITNSMGNKIVGDVKYKIFTGSASASDVYQLLTHAGAFSASKAFLVFPGDSFSVRELGVSKGNIDTLFFSVRLTHLYQDILAIRKYF